MPWYSRNPNAGSYWKSGDPSTFSGGGGGVSVGLTEIAAYTVNGSVVVTDWLQSAFIHMATDQQPVSDRAEEVFCNNRVATGVLMAEVDSCVVQPKRIH